MVIITRNISYGSQPFVVTPSQPTAFKTFCAAVFTIHYLKMRSPFMLANNFTWCYTLTYNLPYLHHLRMNGSPRFPSTAAFLKMDSVQGCLIILLWTPECNPEFFHYMGYEDATPLGLGYWTNDFSFLHTVEFFYRQKGDTRSCVSTFVELS